MSLRSVAVVMAADFGPCSPCIVRMYVRRARDFGVTAIDLDAIDAEQGLYAATVTDVLVRELRAHINGWTDTPSAGWADVHGERALWHLLGHNVWLGITEYDLDAS